MPSQSGLVFQRFAEPALERRYRVDQRLRQAWFTRPMIILGAIGLVLYWAVAFATFERSAALEIFVDQSWLLPMLLLYGWIVGRSAYADAWWADMALYIFIQPPLYGSVVKIAATPAFGWAFNTQFTYTLMLAMAFACLNFIAAVRPFFVLVLASVGYLGIVLWLRGYPPAIAIFTMQNYAFFALIVFFLNLAMDRKARAMFLAQADLAVERGKSERLLGNVLPAPIADRLKSQQVIADRFEEVVVVFVDLVGFTPLSQLLGPERIVELLNAFFERADRGTDLFELERSRPSATPTWR